MQQDGLIPKLLKFMEVNVGAVIGDLESEVEKLPKVTGGGGADSMYASRRLSQLLLRAEKIAGEFKDEYVSVEHMYLALLEEKGTPSSALFRKYNIGKNSFLEALEKVRGNQRVTSQNPEDGYDALWMPIVGWVITAVIVAIFTFLVIRANRQQKAVAQK